MLVLRRREGEGFLIGKDIEIEVLEITQARVKIGIKAPAACSITRREVVLTREENVTASIGVAPQNITWLARKLASLKTLATSSAGVK